MSVMVVVKVPGGTLDQYDQVSKEVFGGTLQPSEMPDGMLSSVAVKTDAGFKVIDVWESQGHFEAFAAKLMPATQKAGIGEIHPRFFDVHNFVKA